MDLFKKMTNAISKKGETDDDKIISRVLSGETDAYEHIVRRYNDYLYKIGRSYGFNHSDTEDLMQEAYVNAYVNLAKFEHRSAFKTWLTRIMLNGCYHKKNKQQTKAEQIAANLDPQNESRVMPNNHHHDTDLKTDNNELNEILENALLSIPEKYRMVFTLRELNDMSVKETANALDLSESNVKVRLHRGKEMLQDELLNVYEPADIFEFNLIYCDDMVENVMNAVKSKTPKS